MALTLNTTSMLYKPSSSAEWSPITITVDMNIDLIYPIGSIYLSVNNTSPASVFGGTWERITGKFLLAATDSGNSGASQAAGNTGGAETINLQHDHTTSGHTLTVYEIPSHRHRLSSNIVVYKSGGRIGDIWAVSGAEFDTNDQKNEYTDAYGGGQSHSHGNTGSALSASQSILPPYLAVYMWKRIA